jgi:hypothetical protein
MSEFMKRCGRSSLTSAAVTVLTLTSVSSPVSAAVPTMVLNSAIGPSGGGNTLVATVPGAAMTFLAGAVSPGRHANHRVWHDHHDRCPNRGARHGEADHR